MGRATHNDFCVPHNEMSREHFILFMDDESYYIQDQGSKNGVYIDGKRIEPHKKIAISIQSQIVIAKILKLSFYRRPGQTELGITGGIELETATETKRKLKK